MPPTLRWLCAAQAAGLVAMVANLTVGKRKYAGVQDRVKEIAERGQALKDFFLQAIDDDTDSFNAVMDCFGMPKGTDAQVTARNLAIAEELADLEMQTTAHINLGVNLSVLGKTKEAISHTRQALKLCVRTNSVSPSRLRRSASGSRASARWIISRACSSSPRRDTRTTNRPTRSPRRERSTSSSSTRTTDPG